MRNSAGGRGGTEPRFSRPNSFKRCTWWAHQNASASGTGDAAGLQAHGGDARIAFATGDDARPPGQAHVYRVTATQQGQLIGGYTVVLLG